MRKKLLSIFTLLCLAVTSAWADENGSCGTSVTYSYVESTHTLTISGSGDMADYSTDNQPWNSNKDNITSVVIESGVTSIGQNAFAYCSYLTSVTIPASVTTIGESAFYACEKLASVTIPSSVTSIGNQAFSGCTGLTSVTFDGTPSLTTIGNNAFYNCSNTNLTSIVIPASVTSIGNSAFESCSNLASVTVFAPKTCTLGSAAFNDCTKLQIYVPSDLVDTFKNTTGWRAYSGKITAIGGNCGATATWSLNSSRVLTISGSGDMANYVINSQPWNSYKDNITSIVIESGVTSIGNWAFRDCTGLMSVTIPASVTSIGEYAFYACKGLTSVTIPASVTSIGQSAFALCIGLASITFASGSHLTTIGVSAFISCTNLTSIEIPASVTSIGNNAFTACSGLTSITFASGSQLTTIGESAFNGCSNTNLTSIEIPASVTSIGNTAFKYCRYLTSVTVYSTSCTLGTQAFDNCASGLKIYVFNDKVENFKNTTGWSTYTDKITVMGGDCGTMAKWSLSSSGVLTISGSGAMTDLVSEDDQPWKDYRTSITSVVIGSGVTSIGASAFKECPDLTSVTFATGSQLTSIGVLAFYDCKSLASIEIPASVTSIGIGVFNYCENLTTITVNTENTTYDSRDNCNAIIETTPKKLVAGCKNSTIPDGVTSIGKGAFRTIGLTSVTIPVSVTSIEDEAFYNCTNLGKTYVLPTTVPTMGSDVFKYCNDENFAIIVPAAKYDDYCSASGWSSYQSKMKNGYTVTCPDGVTATSEWPLLQQGETVTLSGTGDIPTGYIFGGYSVKDADGATVNVTETEGVYTFTMPAADVTVTTTWKMLTLADLAELALDETMQDVVKDGKLKMTVTPKNKYWTLACGVDLLLPKGVVVYKARMNSAGTKVELTEIDATTLGGVLKANNGVLIASTPGQTYDLVVSPNNSVTTLSNADAKSYGTDNELEPVLEDTHFTTEDYFILTENKFIMVDTSKDTKVPAGKAVLKVAAGSAKTRTLDVIDGETTGISSAVNSADDEVWYNLQGQRISKPTRKGVYILNGKKVRK